MSQIVIRPEPNRFARKQPWRFRGKGPNGRNLCFCGCSREVVRPRISCYSDECLTWYKSHNDPGTIRGIVEKRDNGVCALCGVDTTARAREARETKSLILWLARRHAGDLLDRGELSLFCGKTKQAIEYHKYKISMGEKVCWGDTHSWAVQWADEEIEKRFGKDVISGQGHTWEADHIIPVIEGGGGCGPEGYRTLCLGCHHRETAALAARRAIARKKPAPESAG